MFRNTAPVQEPQTVQMDDDERRYVMVNVGQDVSRIDGICNDMAGKGYRFAFWQTGGSAAVPLHFLLFERVD